MTDQTPAIRVIAFYCFVPVAEPEETSARIRALCEDAGIKGTIILAREGYNGTMAGPDEGVEALSAALLAIAGDRPAEIKYAWTDAMPFGRLKVKVKAEIVTMGCPDLDFVHGGGTYVAPEDWNALISGSDTLLVDTRNSYEYAIGTFEGAMDPGTRSFAAFPQWLADLAAQLTPEERQERPLAMFCTGGIRCEKSTALARSLGFGNVFHLKGGILAYLEQVPPDDSRWQGDCFVFDERVSVGHGLTTGGHIMCRICGMPVAEAELSAHRDTCCDISAK